MYVTVAEFRRYAKRFGVELPSDNAECVVLLNKATAFIDSHDSELMGERTNQGQANAYPRVDLEIYGRSFPKDEIPQLVKDCQMAFALMIHENPKIDLYNIKADPFVVEKRLEGVVTKKFAAPSNIDTEYKSTAFTLLKALMKKPRNVTSLKVRRV